MADRRRSLSLTPTPRRKLTESVAKQLFEEIRRQRLGPGSRMPSERELMSSLGVGRSTIREALNGLVMMGVLEIRHGQGAFVVAEPASVTAAEGVRAALAKGVTSDLLEARWPVETEIARLAAIRRTDADLRGLENVLAEHERALAHGQVAAPPSARFHLVLAQAAHNDVLRGFVESFTHLLAERGPRLEEIEGYREWEIDEHRRLFEAVRAGDPELAADRMRAHLEQVAAYHARLSTDSP